jgi:hypothetical protein
LSEPASHSGLAALAFPAVSESAVTVAGHRIALRVRLYLPLIFKFAGEVLDGSGMCEGQPGTGCLRHSEGVKLIQFATVNTVTERQAANKIGRNVSDSKFRVRQGHVTPPICFY